VIPVKLLAGFREKVMLFFNSKADIVFVLHDSIAINCMDSLVQIGNRENITIFSLRSYSINGDYAACLFCMHRGWTTVVLTCILYNLAISFLCNCATTTIVM